MKIVDVGSGPPVVVVPGVQGRWEWMKPCVDALASRCRVITFSLADEASSITDYVAQVRQAMDAAGIGRAAICGVSYGGLIAATFAARHAERTASLVLVSAIPPSWTPNQRIQFYLRAPRLLSPLFCIASVRMYREIAAATPGRAAGVLAALRHGWTAATHLFSPGRMAHRVHMLRGLRLEEEISCVKAPVLVVTGEPALDRVVPVHLTREYLKFWPDAQTATVERTGHLGYITRPDTFTRIVAPFVEQTASAPGARRRVG
jgi:pimeloyl-ACP methyl ester carboxylesterase